MESGKINIKSKEGEFNQNSYVVEYKDSCILIDAGVRYDEIKKITNKPILAVMLTHGHFDHIEYIEEYDRKKIPIYASAYTKNAINDPKLNASYMFGSKVYKVSKINELKDDEIIKIGEFEIKSLSTPGHTRDSVCYLIGDKLFSGDTLFSDSIGRYDFIDSSKQDMLKSLLKLDDLDYLELYPGHGRASNKEEQNQNIKRWITILNRF